MNAGEFDPIDALADLAEEHGAWLHVDGAFGLFARVSPAARRRWPPASTAPTRSSPTATSG